MLSQHALQEEGVLSQHALQVVSQHALQQGGLLLGVCSWGSAPGGSAPRGACSEGSTPLPKADSYCCGWYASYWNAFLFGQFFSKNCMKLKKICLCRSATAITVNPNNTTVNNVIRKLMIQKLQKMKR